MATFVLDPAADKVASVPRSNRPIEKRLYIDKHFEGGKEEWLKLVEQSSNVYVGNLSCYTNEYQIHELFSRCGSIKRIVMGLDKFKKIPCGFCFVEFDERPSALKAISYLNKTQLDGRPLIVDIDAGFRDTRQFGRGDSGGQIGDERRRERERVGGMIAPGHRGGYQGGVSGQSALMTRSITIIACLTMISLLLIVHQPEQASADIVIRGPFFPFGTQKSNLLQDKGRFISYSGVRSAQLAESRTQFEKDLANFLVNLMKAAKPTLMKAFITATLADKQLKEIAIGLFFNSTSTDEES